MPMGGRFSGHFILQGWPAARLFERATAEMLATAVAAGKAAAMRPHLN